MSGEVVNLDAYRKRSVTYLAYGVWVCDRCKLWLAFDNAGLFCQGCGTWHEFPDPSHNDPPDDAA